MTYVKISEQVLSPAPALRVNLFTGTDVSIYLWKKIRGSQSRIGLRNRLISALHLFAFETIRIRSLRLLRKQSVFASLSAPSRR